MKKPQSPCLMCNDRERVMAEHGGNCHGKWCEAWQKYMADNRRYRHAIKDEKARNIEVIQHVKANAIKQRKKHHDA